MRLRLGVLFGMLLLIAAFALAGCGSSSNPDSSSMGPVPTVTVAGLAPSRPLGNLEDSLANGQNALDRGDLVAAEQAYKNALALDPNSAKAYLGLGSVRVRQNRPDEAEQAFKSALALQPDMEAAHVNLGVAYYQMGQFAKAAESLQTALGLDSRDAQAMYMLAVVRLGQNDVSSAKELLLSAQELRPDLPEVYYGLGVAYKLQGDTAQAIAAFEKFLEIGPGQDPAAMDYARQELDALRAGSQ